MKDTIAFIGGGQMAGALISGLLAAGHDAARVRVAEPLAQRADWLREHYGVTVHPAGVAAVEGARVVVLAVKPQVLTQAVAGLRLPAGTIVISIAAGVRIDALRAALGDGVQLVRTMPNTPAQLRSGITGMFAQPDAAPATRSTAEAVMGAVGATVWVPREELLDAVTALSGSGPAYFFLLTELLADAGAALGLDAQTARQLALQTFIGAARMAEGGGDVAQLRQNVTSKGGTTEAAVTFLEKSGVRELFRGALAAANQRGIELGDALAAQARVRR